MAQCGCTPDEVRATLAYVTSMRFLVADLAYGTPPRHWPPEVTFGLVHSIIHHRKAEAPA